MLIPGFRLQEALQSGPYANVVAARISGAATCPLLLWATHLASMEEMERVRRAIKARVSLPEGTRIVLRRYHPSEPGPLRRLIRDSLFLGVSYRLLVERN